MAQSVERILLGPHHSADAPQRLENGIVRQRVRSSFMEHDLVNYLYTAPSGVQLDIAVVRVPSPRGGFYTYYEVDRSYNQYNALEKAEEEVFKLLRGRVK